MMVAAKAVFVSAYTSLLGRMLWFSRKKLAGSYRSLSAVSRCKRAP